MNKNDRDIFNEVFKKLNGIEYKIQGAALLFATASILILFKWYV